MPDHSAFGLADLLPFIAVGFAAQLVDGALGMAFGVISTTLLLSLGVPAGQGLGGRAYGGDLHHRRVGDQPYPAPQRRLAAARADRHSRRDRRRARRLCADRDPCRGGAAVRARLSRLDRPLSGLARPPFPAAAPRRHGEDRRAARPRRRLPRRGRRRRLGTDRHRQSARPGRRSAQDDRHGQHRGIPRHPDHLGDLHRTRSAGRRSPPRPSAC